ncbi:acyl-protein thioesterase [Aphanomyces cochlioides]|nr:acyl-protein thioesterase [Aphanomyces cochlioides]
MTYPSTQESNLIMLATLVHGGIRRVPAKSIMSRASSTHAISVDDSRNITLKPKGSHTASLIFIHGLGDTAYGWVDSVAHISQTLPHLKCILPTGISVCFWFRVLTWFFLVAKTQPVSLNMGMPMPSWYDIQSLSDREGDPCSGIEESRSRVQKLIQDEVDAGIPLSRIVLGGFSQGGAMSLYTGYQMTQPLGGVLVLSGYLPNQAGFHAEEASKNVPLLMCHGEDDNVVRLEWAKKSLEVLKASGVSDTEFKLYPDMPHSACLEELEDVQSWLKKRLPSI